MKKYVKITFAMVLLAAVVSPSTFAATPMDLALPVYTWPSEPYLQDLLDPVKTPLPPAIVVVNLNNGESGQDQMDATADALRARVSASGEHVKVVAYVYTSRAARSLAEVQKNIDDWLTPRGGFRHYDGIFVDEVTRECGAAPGGMESRDYYRALRQHIQAILPDALVINNVGTAVDTCYLDDLHRTADIFITFEGQPSVYQQQASAANGWVGYSGNVFDVNGYSDGSVYGASSFWHLIYNVTDSRDVDQLIRIAANRGVGFLGITDDYMTNTWINPWDAMPSFLTMLAENLRVMSYPSSPPTGPSTGEISVGSASQKAAVSVADRGLAATGSSAWFVGAVGSLLVVSASLIISRRY